MERSDRKKLNVQEEERNTDRMKDRDHDKNIAVTEQNITCSATRERTEMSGDRMQSSENVKCAS